MALTTTYISGAVGASDQNVSLAAFTSPALVGISPKVIGRFATGEYVNITGNSSTTIFVQRGTMGSATAAHSAREGFQYGLVNDPAWPSEAAAVAIVAPVLITNAQEVTLTGTTGTDAGVVVVPSPAILNCSGASGAGVNLPVPKVGQSYVVKNSSSGTMKIYCVGGSINGTTGTTAVTITTTGALGDQFFCATAGAWQTAPLSV